MILESGLPHPAGVHVPQRCGICYLRRERSIWARHLTTLFAVREGSGSRTRLAVRRPFLCTVVDRLSDGQVRAVSPCRSERCRLRRSVAIRAALVKSVPGPMDVIGYDDAKMEKVGLYVRTEAKAYTEALDANSNLIEGFESPLGMGTASVLVDGLQADQRSATVFPDVCYPVGTCNRKNNLLFSRECRMLSDIVRVTLSIHAV
jgi:hypothetical protein